MTDELEDLKRRLVTGHKRDGRSVYDAAAKAQLVALCLQPGASVSRLARECGANANQVSRWLREHSHGSRAHQGSCAIVAPPAAFVQVSLPPVSPVSPAAAPGTGDIACVMHMQARLPKGVAIEIHGVGPQQVGPVIDALGRLQCSVSTKG